MIFTICDIEIDKKTVLKIAEKCYEICCKYLSERLESGRSSYYVIKDAKEALELLQKVRKNQL